MERMEGQLSGLTAGQSFLAVSSPQGASSDAPPPPPPLTGKTLREQIVALQLPAVGRWAGAGERFVGDAIPPGVWGTAVVPEVQVEDEGEGGGADDGGGAFEQLDEEMSLLVNSVGERRPVLIRSRSLGDRHRRAAQGCERVRGASGGKFLGGRKLFVMFPLAEREKLLLDGSTADSQVKNAAHWLLLVLVLVLVLLLVLLLLILEQVYIDPIRPPADTSHPCYTVTTLYFIDLWYLHKDPCCSIS